MQLFLSISYHIIFLPLKNIFAYHGCYYVLTPYLLMYICVVNYRMRVASGLVRTKKWFGGLLNDIKRKKPFYITDFLHGLHPQCISSFLFLYFACLTPIVAFGALLGEATENRIATIESLVSGKFTHSLYCFQLPIDQDVSFYCRPDIWSTVWPFLWPATDFAWLNRSSLCFWKTVIPDVHG